jgi:hypothetical protein
VEFVEQDLDSPKLTKKHHWNAFTTAAFVDASYVEAELEARGHVDPDLRKAGEEHLKEPLRCHRCHLGFSQMPPLKAHIRTCRAPLSA